jgi:hypothetical protein
MQFPKYNVGASCFFTIKISFQNTETIKGYFGVQRETAL